MSNSAPFYRMWPLLQRNRPIRYSTNLAQIVGSVKAAILLSQMIYWTKKGVGVKANEGWFRKQAVHWTIETGLTRHEQDTARRILVQLGFLEIRHKVGEGKKAHGEAHYRLNLERIGHALADLIGQEIEAMNPLNLDDLQADSDIVRQMLGKHVSYHRVLVDIAGNTTSALLLSRMIYLQRRTFSAGGGDWFSVTVEFYRQELGMNRRQQESARKLLLQKKLIIESLLDDEVRRYRRLYQKVNVDVLTADLEKAIADGTMQMVETDSSARIGATYKSGNRPTTTHVQNRQPQSSDAASVHTQRGQSVAAFVRGSTAPVIDNPNALFLPKGITGQELKDFTKWVAQALPHRQQLLIDEFEYQRKRRTISSPVSYIRSLVRLDAEAAGELPLEGAYGVAKRRENEAGQHQAAVTDKASKEAPRTPESLARAQAAREVALEAARAMTGAKRNVP